jgi:hypothetical protein
MRVFEGVRLYWLNNGPRAAFRKERNFIFVDGAMHKTRCRQESGEELQNPIVRGDRSLSLWCLVAKRYTVTDPAASKISLKCSGQNSGNTHVNRFTNNET